MPEAGRRVKCSETHQPSLRTSYPHMQTLSKRTSDPTPIYFSSIFFCIFFCLAVIQLQRLPQWEDPLPAQLSVLHIKSAGLKTLQTRYLVLLWKYGTVDIYSSFFHTSRLYGFILYLTQLQLDHQEPATWPCNGTTQMNSSCMSLIQYQFLSISITH